MRLLLYLCFAIMCLALHVCNALTSDQMFPFGYENGDTAEGRNDDSYVQVNLNTNFPFFGTPHNVLFVDTNGDLTFDNGLPTYTPSAFPLFDNAKMVAPYWSDVDTLLNSGLVYYRQTTDANTLATGSAQIKNYFPEMQTYKATWMFIATWYNVTFYGGNTQTPTNTFQCALITDGTYSYAIYNYLKIVWTTGTASGGNMQGLGGTPAQVGFDAGDGINFFAIPQSRTADVVNVGSMSNLNPFLPGKFIYNINDVDIHNVPVVHIETCRAATDPHFTTYDGEYYSPQEPPGEWYLASAPVNFPNNTLPWAVWFSTSYWDSSDYATCITDVQIDIAGQTVVFGMNGYLRINDLDVIAPWYYPSQDNTSFVVVTYGQTGHMLTTVDQVKVMFTGASDNTLTIMAPLETYEGDMQGACGNMDGNPNNDPTCPSGKSVDECWQKPDGTTTIRPPTTTSMLRPARTTVHQQQTTARQSRGPVSEATTIKVATNLPQNATTKNFNPSQTTTSPERPATTEPLATTSAAQQGNTTAVQQQSTSARLQSTTAVGQQSTTSSGYGCTPQMQTQIDHQCQIIMDPIGPFGICVTNASDIAQNYYQSCIYDLCINSSNPNVLCSELQSYADACMQEVPTAILQWRTEYFCPPNCSANMHYDDCAPSCPATCGNPQAPITCPLPCRGDCTCNDGYIFDSGTCILPTQCGCTDLSGVYHQYGSNWITPDCAQNCSCGDDHGITCIPLAACATNATCQVQNGQRNCYCLPGFTGDGTLACAPIDYCLSDPCLNGATCSNENLGYSCHCAIGYSGVNCEQFYPLTTAPPTFTCIGKPNGNYGDPNNPCSPYFFMCSNDYTYTFQCPASLVFNPITLDCDYASNVPGCS